MTDKQQPTANADSAPYWNAAKEDRLVIQKCRDCGHLFFLPSHLCPSCWSDQKDWVDAKGAGTVHSFSIIHRAPLPSYRDDVPYVVALIDLAEGPRMMSNIVGEGALDVEIGSPVTMCFEERGDAKVPQFQLAK